MRADDPGRPNRPGSIQTARIRWAHEIPTTWWRNVHQRAEAPFAFSSSGGRFSAPDLDLPVLYLGADPIVCFWECGLGRDLNSRMPCPVAIPEAALKERIEYRVTFASKGTRIFDATDPAARRSIGAKTVACFAADHEVCQAWASSLAKAGADGILYHSTRQDDGRCLALFDTPASRKALGRPRKVRTSYDNPELLAQFFSEGIRFI